MEATQEQPTLETLQQQYSQAASQYGDLCYRIKCFEGDANELVAKMQQINQTAKKLIDEKKAAGAVVPEVVEEEVE